MKKLLLATMLAASALSVFGQGVVSMNTAISGGPKATNSVTGLPLQLNQNTNGGAGQFFAQLYWAAGADNVGVLTAVTNPIATFGTNSSFAGFISSASGGGNRILPVSGAVTVQIRAWSATGGLTYEEAYTGFLAGDASIFIGSTVRINANAVVPPTTPGSIVGPGYVLTPAPEPSSIALGLLGLGAIALFRRRK
jgi:MYXO-CTERM domain-containing protein